MLVPVKDVVTVPLSEISQAAADSLGGGEATRVPMERFCMTLESVFRTEFSVKVDRANAGSVIGGRRHRHPGKRKNQSASDSAAAGARAALQTTKEAISSRTSSGDVDEIPGGEIAAAITVGGKEMAASAVKIGSSKTGDKSEGGWWKRGWGRGKKKEQAASGDKGGPPPGGPSSATATPALPEGRPGRRGGGAGKKKNRGGGGGGRDDRPEEAAAVPLLELVEELVKNAMFSPIGARDVMMSQVKRSSVAVRLGVNESGREPVEIVGRPDASWWCRPDRERMPRRLPRVYRSLSASIYTPAL